MINYKIFLRDKDGMIVSELTDVINLSISDVMNNLGSWKITNRTKGRHPFYAGYGIVVYREGNYLYSGFMDKVDATLNPDGSWSWTASGKNDLEALNWRVIYPDPSDESPILYRYDELRRDNYYINGIINSIIRRNASSQAPSERGGGLSIIAGTDIEYPITTSRSTENKTYRFENLLKTVIGLCEEGNLIIRPRWDDTNHQITYYLTDGRDLSESVVFSQKTNDISAVHHILQAPDYTRLIYQFNSDKENDTHTYEMWQYIEEADLIDPISQSQLLKNSWDAREHVESPSDQQFDGEYNTVVLFDLLTADKKKTKIYTEGYELEFQSSGTAPMYQVDYKLGDIVGLQFEDQSVVGRVTKVEINYSRGSETIKPSIDAFNTGPAGIIKSEIKQLGDDVSKLQLREV